MLALLAQWNNAQRPHPAPANDFLLFTAPVTAPMRKGRGASDSQLVRRLGLIVLVVRFQLSNCNQSIHPVGSHIRAFRLIG
jgi:hypothetical protein